MSRQSMMEAFDLTEKDFEPKPKALDMVDISREDYELLDVEDNVIYRIIEEDGSVTIRKGENI